MDFASHTRFSPSVRVLLEELSQQHRPSQFLAALAAKDKACAQLGTLGGGNHFLEVRSVKIVTFTGLVVHDFHRRWSPSL